MTKDGSAKPQAKRRRFPTWLKIVAVVFLGIGVLLLLAPTIASTSPVRGYVLGKVNESLNGKVEVTSWSLGWVTGFKANGVRVLDASGQPILQLASITTDLSVTDIARQNFSLGEAVIDGLDVQLRREIDGEFNLAKLTKPAPQPAPAEPAPVPQPSPAPGTPAPPAEVAEPTKLPDVSGRLVIRNSKATFEDVAKKQAVAFPSIDGNVNIPSINDPIENKLTVLAVPAGGPQGKLTIAGTVDAIEDNEVHPISASVKETIRLEGLAMSAVAAFMPPGTIERIDGMTNADVSIDLTPGQKGELKARIVTTNLAATGPALSGDTFTAREFLIDVSPVVIDMSSGHGDDWMARAIRTGGDQPTPIRIAVKHDGYEDVVTLNVNATPQSLMNLRDNAKPRAAGMVELTAAVNVGGLAKQLPHVITEQDGRRLTAGMLRQSLRVTLAPDNASIDQSLKLTDVAVTQTADGKVETLQPVEQTFKASTFGGGWAMPDLRDIQLGLTSGFAKGNFAGKELAQLKGSLDGDLAKLQREIGFLLPLDGGRMAGTFGVTLESTGDVASQTAPLDLRLAAAIAGLQLDGVAGLEKFQLGHTYFGAAAQVLRGAKGIDALNGVRVVAQAGRNDKDLAVDTELTADVKYADATQVNASSGKPETVRVANVPRYTIARFNVDLPKLQRDLPQQFAPLVEQGVRIDSGLVTFAGGGSYTPKAATFDVKGGINRLTLTRQPAGAKTPTPVLRDYVLTLDVAGSHALEKTSAGTRVARLSIADNQQMLTLRKGDAEIVIPSAADRQPSGEVVLGADLKKLVDVSRAMNAEPTPAGAANGPELESGRLDGSLKLAESPGGDKLVALTGRLAATGISVRTEREPIRDQQLVLTPSVRFAPDFSVVHIDEVKVEGPLVNGRVFDTVLDTAAGDAPNAAPLAIVQKANVSLDFPGLADLHAIMQAISPPEPVEGTKTTVEAAKPAGEAPAPPGRILAGSANLKLTLAHEGTNTVVTPELVAKGLVIGAGEVSKNVGDVNVRTTVHLVPGGSMSPDATLMQTLRELSVPTLSLAGAGANVKLERPLVIKDPGGAATVNALLVGQVKLAELFSALEAWNGAKPGTMYPYAGDMTLRQEVASAGNATALVGRADIANFSTVGEGGAKFSEPKIAFVNSIDLDSAGKVLKLNEVSLSTETTKAIRLVMNGVVRQYDTTRQLENVLVDLEYDAKPLWEVLRPIMDPETGGKSLEEFALAGKFQRRMELSGTYPADDPHAIRFVKATGGFALETLSGRGLDVKGLDLRFLLNQGILKLEHVGSPTTAPAPAAPGAVASVIELPPGATCNGGTFSVHGITIDLTGDHMRLNTPDNHPLIRGASVNPVVADSLIGRFVNPAFEGATQAKGLLDVTIVSCRSLALDTAMQSSDPAISGRAELKWSLTDLFLGQPELVGLIAKIKPNALNGNGVAGGIKDGRIVLQGGRAISDMTFNVDKYAVRFNGGIGLAENTLFNFFVTLPKDLFAAIDEKFARHVPAEGYRIQLSGTTDNWMQNASQSILPIIADLGIRAGLGSLLDRDKDKGRDRPKGESATRDPAAPEQSQQPERAAPADPLADLLDRALGGDRETDEEKEARRAKVRQERAEREAAEKAAAATQPAATQPVEKPLTKKERERLRAEEKRREREEKERQKKENRQNR